MQRKRRWRCRVSPLPPFTSFTFTSPSSRHSPPILLLILSLSSLLSRESFAHTMAWYSKFNPTPSFPSYTGPYPVGSVDVELPVDSLDAPSHAPDSTLSTVAFRIFYPCELEPTASSRPVRWIPSPQRGYVSAYARFLGANPTLANMLSLFPQLLYYITIPVQRNARLLSPDRAERWPVMVFSHGLGGSRNAYSHICGSVASHGVVVIAPDHRDGSSPIQYVRETASSKARTVGYRPYPHEANPEVYDGRDAQLKVRLWEVGTIHDAITKIDRGSAPKNLDPNNSHSRKKEFVDVLSMFRGKLDVHRPGAIAWAGHSFGAATMYQLLKSTYYRPEGPISSYRPLFTPDATSSIVQQITPSSPLILLDMWCFPLTCPSTRWIWEKPLPCYASPDGPGGRAILSVLSEGFFKWREHLVKMKQSLSSNPTSDSPLPRDAKDGPRFFYPVGSAHLSQSDFGVVFPWMTKKVFKSEDPERTLRLNTRAIMQHLRDAGWRVADTSALDREEQQYQQHNNSEKESGLVVDGRGQDWKILDPKGGVKGWVTVSLDLNDQPSPSSSDSEMEEHQAETDIMPDITKKPSNSRRKSASSNVLRNDG